MIASRINWQARDEVYANADAIKAKMKRKLGRNEDRRLVG